MLINQIQIFSLTERNGKEYVAIDGHVTQPGKYPFQKNMTLYDLLFKAGGFDDPLYKRATFLGRADIFRYDQKDLNKIIIPFNLGEILENKGQQPMIFLEPGDEVKIYSKNDFNDIRSVAISGTIRKPGDYIYKKNMNLYLEKILK